MIIVGDFNVDCMSPSRALFSKLLRIASSFVLSQAVLNPPITVTGIASVFDAASHVLSCTTIPPPSTSDNMGIFLSYKIPSASKQPRSSSKREVWCYSLGDFEKLKEMLDQIDWKYIIDETDMNVSWKS